MRESTHPYAIAEIVTLIIHVLRKAVASGDQCRSLAVMADIVKKVKTGPGPESMHYMIYMNDCRCISDFTIIIETIIQ